MNIYFCLDISEDLLGFHIINNRNRLPCPPEESFAEDTRLFYEKILLNCWSYNPLFRPSFSYLNEIFHNYFDVIEPDYDFNWSTQVVPLNTRSQIFDELIEAKVDDDINLGLLLSAGNYSEIWKGTVKSNPTLFKDPFERRCYSFFFSIQLIFSETIL